MRETSVPLKRFPDTTYITDQVRSLWIEILGDQTIEPTSNFLQLGGHTASATLLTSALQERLNSDVTLRDVLENPVLRDMIGVVEKRLRHQENKLKEIEEDYLASPEQEALWTLYQLRDGKSSEYQNSYLIEFDHHVSAEHLSNAVNIVLDRHKIIRSRFQMQQGTLHGKIVPGRKPLEVEEVSTDFVQGYFREEARKSFNLEEAPPVRFRLFHLDTNRSLLLVHYHQILHDQDSESILRHEIKACYHSLRTKAPIHLAPIDSSYTQYVDFERKKSFQMELDYWTKKLKGYHPTSLGLEGAWRLRTTSAGKRYAMELTQTALQSLDRLQEKTGTNEFSVFLAAFYVLLSRYTSDSDLAIGSLISKRERKKFGNTVGLFLNSIILRANLDESKSFEQFLKQQVGPAVKEANQFNQVPLKYLADEMTKQWGGRSQNLFNVAFSEGSSPTQSKGPEGVSDHIESDFCQFDLSCKVFESESTYRFEFTYSTELYKPALIAELAANYKLLLSSLILNAAKPIKDIFQRPTIDNTKSRLWERSKKESWDSSFRAMAARQPNSIAIDYKGISLSYRELDVQSERLSLALQAHIDRRQERMPIVVGVFFERSPEMLISLVAILKAGYAYLPLNPSDPVERRRIILEDSNARVVVMSDNIDSDHPNCTKHLEYSKLAENLSKPIAVQRKPHFKDLAYLIYTSGTTGKPKGVMVEHEQLVNYQTWFAKTVGTNCFERVDFSSNLVFDASITTTLVALGLGKRVSICPSEIKQDPVQFLNYVREHKIHLIKTTPSYFNQLIPYISRIGSLPDLKFVLNTGEEMSPVDSKKWLRQFPNHTLLNSYGPTEATVTVSKFPVSAVNCDSFSTRIPIESTSRWCQFLVLDDRLRPVPTGVEGELCLAGPILSRGYLNNPKENRERFIDVELDTGRFLRMYRTGDRCIRFSNGEFYLRGRKDSQFKMRGGFRVELEEINSVIRSHPQVLNSVVIAHNDERFSHLISYIVVHQAVRDQASGFVEELRQYLMQRMPSYMIPPHMICVEEIKLTPSGKIDSNAMGRFAPPTKATLGPFQASGPLEVTLLQLWREVLKQQRVSVDSNFFHLGGNSLLAMELVTKVRDALATELNFNVIFSHPTIRSLSRVLRGSCENEHFIHFSRRESKPSLFLVHPATGLAGLYSGIANVIESANVVGISNDRFGNAVSPYEELEQMALQYADQIFKAHSTGDLYLGGFCSGGAVAFEIANTLRKRQVPIAGLCLIDSFNIERQGNKEEEEKYHASVLAARGLAPNSFFGKKLLFELKHNRTLVLNYQPSPLPIKTLILKGNDLDDYGVDPQSVRRLSEDDNGWKRFIPSSLKEVHTIEASHTSLFREDGMPEQLGKYVQHFINRHSVGES